MKILKYTVPTRFDKLPIGTLWEIEDTMQQFVQTSIDSTRPKWLPFNEVIKEVISKCTLSGHMVRKIVDLFHTYK